MQIHYLLAVDVCMHLMMGGGGGHGGAVVRHSLPTSEAGGSNPEPYVGKMVVAD